VRSHWITDSLDWIDTHNGVIRSAVSSDGLIVIRCWDDIGETPEDGWTRKPTVKGCVADDADSEFRDHDSDATRLGGFAFASWYEGSIHCYYSVLVMKDWFLMLLSGIYPLLALTMSRIRRKPSGFCRKCNYDLRATPDRCPECGTINKRLHARNSRNPPAAKIRCG
jgi:hypothetical protein